MDAVKYVTGYVVRYMVYVYMKNLLFISVSHFPEHLCALQKAVGLQYRGQTDI
jgi:hypothetical protein